MVRVTLLLGLILLGCGGAQAPTSYKDQAQYVYREAQSLLDDGNYLEALNQFNKVKNEFPYSPYAALAALGVGHVYFAEEKYVEAIDVYRLFVRSYPEHAEVPTALYKESRAFFEQRPSEVAIFPPAYERDRGPTNDAILALDRFLTRFPSDKRVKNAQKMRRDCRGSLADYELYVAQFYLEQNKPWSARQRLEKVFMEFEDTPSRWRKASVLLVDTYLQLSQPLPDDIEAVPQANALAKKIVQALAERYPNAEELQSPLIQQLR